MQLRKLQRLILNEGKTLHPSKVSAVRADIMRLKENIKRMSDGVRRRERLLEINEERRQAI